MINQNNGSRNLIALFVGMDDDDDEQIPLVVRVANKDMRQACEDGAELLYEAYVMRLDRLVSLSKPETRDSNWRQTWFRGLPSTQTAKWSVTCQSAIPKLRELYRTALTKWFPYIIKLYHHGSPVLMESLKGVVDAFEREADKICRDATPGFTLPERSIAALRDRDADRIAAMHRMDPPGQRITLIGDGEVGKTCLLMWEP